MHDVYVYILKCSDGSYYVGHTDDIATRIDQHKESKLLNSYVSKRLPFELVFVDCVPSRADALAFEQQIKKWSRKKKEALIQGNWEKISLYVKKKFEKNKD